MRLKFCKYQGTGNDFVMIDLRSSELGGVSVEMVQQLCDRKMGIGADGLIVLKEHPTLDFEMIYWNADGSQSFCGNGSRCAVQFASHIGIINAPSTRFLSTDGEHSADFFNNGWISILMHDVTNVEEGEDYFYLNTGSPHYIKYVDDVDVVDVYEEGRAIRYNDRFRAEGTNVNFVQVLNDGIKVRTYERGVEGETLSCGTGVTAAAITASIRGIVPENKCNIKTLGGDLMVSMIPTEEKGYTEICLAGPATFVFEGEIEV